MMPPSWPTKSAPSSPGRASCHSVKVRIGISLIRRVVGLVWERPRTRRARFSIRSSRSMVAALMSVSFWRVSGSKASSRFFQQGHLRAQDGYQPPAAQAA